MLHTRALPRTLALAFALGAAACSQSFEPEALNRLDATAQSDATALSDTGGQMDAGSTFPDAVASSDDAAPVEDATPGPDGGEALDATPGPDVVETPDATPGPDVAETLDANPGPDVVEPRDATPGLDAFEPLDAAPGPDVVEPRDATPGPDVVEPRDATPGPDVGEPLDAAPGPDVVEPRDATPGQDAVVEPADAGFPSDAGFPVDSGPAQARLTVTRDGTGGGVVGSSPAGINCGPDCTEDYTLGTVVTLTAAPATGSLFVAWTGACTGTGPCVVTMEGPRSVGATFAIQSFPVSVSRLGGGMGTVTSSPQGIDCGLVCSSRYGYGTMLVLTAAPAMGSVFLGWGGACAGTTTTCMLRVESPLMVIANFETIRYDLTTARIGAGTGVITSTPPGINCGGDCTESYASGTMVTLNPQPGGGSVFAGWSGDCTGTGACVVTMTQARAVIARFDPSPRTLTVQIAASMGSSGRVTSAPAGIDCGNDCSEAFPFGTSVTLTAMPGANSTFTGWFGACMGNQLTCTVNMTDARQVFAAFDVARFALTVTRSGTGNGRVTSNPGGINCPTDCTEPYASGTMVTLTAAPSMGSTFIGWSGGPCLVGTGSDMCRVTVDQARTVNAQFDLQTFTLSVRAIGNGGGTVTSNPAGIACPPDCSETYNFGTQVTLTPAPSPGSGFAGWGEDCTGSGTCAVTVSANRAVTARFELGLVAWYPFSGNAQDASRNNHNGTSFGASLTNDRRGAANSAASFGLGDYIEVPDAPDLDGAATMTWCVWVQSERFTGVVPSQMYVLSKEFLGDNDPTTDAYSLRVTAPPAREPLIEVWTSTAGDSIAQQNGAVQPGNWTHLCGVYDGTFLNLYVNSGNTGSGTLSGPIRATTAPLRIGKCGGDQRCDALTWIGNIDEVKLWSRPLSPGEINEEFTR